MQVRESRIENLLGLAHHRIYPSALPLPDHVAYARLPTAFTLAPCCAVPVQVLDPVLAPVAAAQRGETVTPPFGIFLKDYMETEW